MKRKQRQIIALLTTVIMLLSLMAGCGMFTPEVPAQSTEEVTEEPTTEALTTEEPITEDPTTEDPTMEAPQEVIEYHLDPVDSYFRMTTDSIEQADDHYIISGRKIWGGMVLLTAEQKAKMEDGAVLKLIHEGEVVDQIAIDISTSEDGAGKWYKNMTGLRVFLQDTECALLADRRDVNREWLTKTLEEEPYNGSGFYLAPEHPSPLAPLSIVVETEVQLEVPGEVEIYPENYFAYHVPGQMAEYMPIEQFYQEIIVKKNYSGKGMYLHVYVSEGEIAEIIEQYVP